jgi:hypothetical protein
MGAVQHTAPLQRTHVLTLCLNKFRQFVSDCPCRECALAFDELKARGILFAPEVK